VTGRTRATLWRLGGRRVLRGVGREYRAASRRAARTRGFAAPAFAGCAFVDALVRRADHEATRRLATAPT
jgi:hypothetical protein